MSINVGENSINEFPEGIPNLLQVGETTYIVIPADKENLNVLGISTIEPSAKQVEVEGLSASVPNLVLPSFYLTDVDKLTNMGLRTGGLEGVSVEGPMILINLSAFSMSLEEQYHEIAVSMLDKWVESIEKIKEQVQEERMSTGYRNWLDQQTIDTFETKDISRVAGADLRTYVTGTEVYKEWVQSLPPVEKAHELNVENRYRILVGMEHALTDYRESEKSQAVPFVMASLAIGMTYMSDFVGLISGSVGATTQAGVSTVLQAVTQMSAPILEQNLAALGYFGALFAVGTLYQTSDQIALNVGRQSAKKVSVKFAEEYAKNMIKLIKSPDFNLFLKASVVLQLRDGKLLTDIEKGELVNAMKLVLLSVALAVIYKAETGKITAEEFGAMLTNKILLKDEPLKAQLKALILAKLKQLGKLKQPMIEAIIEYLNSDPKFDDLFDVYKVFEGIRQTETFTEEVHTRQRS